MTKFFDDYMSTNNTREIINELKEKRDKDFIASTTSLVCECI